MGFQFSAVFDIMWNHPLVCGSILLLLTPSLFHILLYFSPLLISTTLFIIALISMKPRLEETTEERERWAKGEKSIPSVMDESWPYGDWSQASNEAVAVKRRRSEVDGSGPTWMEVIEEWKIKLASWVDEVFKAGELKPLAGEPVAPPAESKKKSGEEDGVTPSTVRDHPPVAFAGSKLEESAPPKTLEEVSSRTLVEIVEEVEEKPVLVAPESKVLEVAPIEVKEIDMPELETVEAPLLEQVSVAGPEKIPAKSGPIWDEEAPATPPPAAESSPPVPFSDDELLEVSLHDPVQETVREDLEEILPVKDLVKTEEPPKKNPEEILPAKEINRAFKSSPVSKEPTTTSPAASARDVHRRILKDLHTQLDELQSKRRAKYTQVLSRRTSTKNTTGL
ncbi:hypothetical protein SELMODRAFT_441424 [Selaginella moellendorffii]|uniref:Uncharacterized protein n=2 Tax=Selaginella moellendorffii TaxID=88036 RepID=D8RJF4_SELML|nr:fibrous sheath CABYR-binding protein isoform X1 [Selaginella moellendorffii]XP_024531617.1 fibrous sheath CABYR-binding protein isoform X1 [Selaginella moellendorffii]XP_024531618.1 fibrous sheath CABYR-binding protein isoform X1 [Selaginella moellendorffii]XP_024531619.1 fibrous sheath CABYR-binding protein isoform X1 [Selaginella moellendorffii]XP_024531620.1 fibrous sheath CABYR-binding protein isoform X1 [Selaginella moellendorffii]EFJ27707.1 hypothetical protein SELMODRAFT_441424 [Sela|eukprot:XP_002971109.1 fibrous sheath CABYR-binding protein isoform X1 [Selaginella moellendorffii]